MFLGELWLPMGCYNFRVDLRIDSLHWETPADVALQRTLFISVTSNRKSGSAPTWVCRRKSYNRYSKMVVLPILRTHCGSNHKKKGLPLHSHVNFITFRVTLCFPRYLVFSIYLRVASLQKFYLPFSKYCALYSWSNYTAYKGTFDIAGQYIKLGLFLIKKRSTQKCCRSEAASFYLCSVSFLILIAKSLWRCAFNSKFRTWPMLSSSHEMLHQMYSFTSNVHTKIGWLKSRSVLFSQMANCS